MNAGNKQPCFSFTLLLFIFVCIISASIYIFASGFLLTRSQLQEYSSCEVQPSPFRTDAAAVHSNSERCWRPAQMLPYKKVILFIIDALRFDFAAYNEDPNTVKPYQNNLPVLKELMQSHSNSCAFYKFVADAPTATSQRLKALTTGGLPTFIDAGKNFESDEITEDNIIHHLKAQRKRIAHLGDDTWIHLFPTSSGYFARSRAFPSFNVWDLHSVDDGVLKYLSAELSHWNATQLKQHYEEMDDNKFAFLSSDDFEDHNVLIAHFLGVDHAGHRYGVDHPAMWEKTQQMNKVIVDTIKQIEGEQDTLLLVFGDHGMTDNGDHGGNADIETDSALFAYSPGRKLWLSDKGISHNGKQNMLKNFRTVAQVDLVPTLSLLLDVPIPYGNLGSVMYELIGGQYLSQTQEQIDPANNLISLKTINEALHQNCWQVYRYLITYSQKSSVFPPQKMANLQHLFELANHQYQRLFVEQHREDFAYEDYNELFQQQTKYLHEALEMCKESWAEFNLPYMVVGCSVLILSCIAMACLIYTLSSSYQSQEYLKTTTLHIVSSMLKYSALGLVVSLGVVFSPGLGYDRTIVVLGVTSIFSVIGFFYGWRMHVKEQTQNSTSDSNIEGGGAALWPNYFSAILMAMLLVSSLSNSFIVSEDRVILFFLTTLGFFHAFKTFRAISTEVMASKLPRGKNLILATLVKNRKLLLCLGIYFLSVKLSTYSIRFRTHGTHLVQDSATILTLAGNYFPHAINMSLLVIFLLVIPVAAFRFFLSGRVPSQHAKMVNGLLYGYIPLSTLLVLVYWYLYAFNYFEATNSNLIVQAKTWLPRCVFILFGLIMAVYLRYSRRIFDKILFYTCMLAICYVPLMMIGGYQYAPNFVLYVAQVLAFVYITTRNCSTARSLLSQGGNRTLCPEFHLVFSWFLMSYQYYFCTGHQNTFNTIQWNSAFVGIDQAHNFYGAILVILNTLSSQVLCALCLPLVLFSVYGGPWNKEKDNHKPVNIDQHRFRHAFAYLLLHVLVCCVTMLFVTYERRHLMMWAIFAPKFIFDILKCLVVGVVLLVSVLANR